MLSSKPGILDVPVLVAYVVRHWNRVKGMQDIKFRGWPPP